MYENVKGKRLLILGGIAMSCEIVRAAKEMGVVTIVVDYLPDSPAKKISDEAYLVSTTDVDALVDLCQEIKIDGIITGYVDLLLPYAYELAKRLSLPFYATKEQLDITLNKDRFKEVCHKYHVPVVEEYQYDQIDGSEVHYPVIVKPIDNSGGRGITICYDREALDKAYDYAMSFSKEGKVLIEHYVRGTEATAFYVFENGVPTLLGVGDRYVEKMSDDSVIPLPVGYGFPSVITDYFMDNVHPYLVDMFQGIGMQNGMIFLQGLIEDDHYYVIDPGYRLTGSLEYHLTEQAYGYNALKHMIEHSLTGDMGIPRAYDVAKNGFREYYVNLTFMGNPGTIAKMIDPDEIKKINGVIDAVPNYFVGDTISEKAVGTLAQAYLRVFAYAETEERIKEIIRQVEALIYLEDTEGRNMCLKMFPPERLIFGKVNRE